MDAKYDRKDILKAIKKALSKNFSKKIKNLKNPYGNGNSSKKIINIVKKLKLKNFITQKKITY